MFTPDCSPWEQLGQHLKDQELECSVVAIMPEDASLIEEDAGARQRGLDHLKASIDSCVAVGAKLWIVRPAGFRIDDARLRRAGLDYWQHLELGDAIHWDDLIEPRWLARPLCRRATL